LWYGIKDNAEVDITTLPYFVSLSGTNDSTLVIDAMYGENITILLKVRTPERRLPVKVYRTVTWRIPNVDTIVVCKNGGAVRSETSGKYLFETIVNCNGKTLSDTEKAENLRFNWITRKAEQAASAEVNRGWGQTLLVDASDLMNVVGSASEKLSSSLVRSEAYILGAFQPVTHENNNVTYNGQQVYCRTTF